MKIGIVGCAGRMGRMLMREVLSADDCTLSGAIEVKGNACIGQDAGVLAGGDPIGVPVTDDAVTLFAEADAVIDCTTPDATAAFSRLAAQGKTIHIIGTT